MRRIEDERDGSLENELLTWKGDSRFRKLQIGWIICRFALESLCAHRIIQNTDRERVREFQIPTVKVILRFIEYIVQGWVCLSVAVGYSASPLCVVL